MYQSKMYSSREVSDVNYHPVLKSNRYHHYIVNDADLVKKSKDKMADKQPVSTNTKTETKTVSNADGSTTKTITTTTTEKFADGSTSTKTKVQTITEGAKPSGSTGGNVTTYSGMDDIKAQQAKAEKAKVTSTKDFLKDALKAHNNYRKKHGVKPLELSDDLCKVSQAWANQLAKEDRMAHSNNGYGENVFWTSTSSTTGSAPVDSWYEEIKDFNWNKVDHQPGTGHFTQVVWKSSEKLGIACATGKSGTYVVANYEPAGNFLGQYPQNVLSLK